MSKNNIWNLVFAGAVGGMLMNLVKQYVELDDGTKEEFSWKEFFKWTAVGGTIGGGVGIIADLVIQGKANEQRRFRQTAYLRSVLKSYDPKDSSEFDFQRRKASEIRDAIQEEFQQYVYRPKVSGSHGKGTGIAGSSDFDLLVPFPKHAFRTLEEMFEATYSFLEEYAAGDYEIRKVRKQGVSLGLLCNFNGIDTRIDIVPARERNDYLADGDLSLHVRARDYFSQATFKKTNIAKHKELMKGHKSKRELVRLLKVWKDREGLELSGFELELLVDRVYADHSGYIQGSLFSKLVASATLIHQGLDSIDLRDPGVKSNRILDDPDRRRVIQRKLGKMLDEISMDPASLERHFPHSAQS